MDVTGLPMPFPHCPTTRIPTQKGAHMNSTSTPIPNSPQTLAHSSTRTPNTNTRSLPIPANPLHRLKATTVLKKWNQCSAEVHILWVGLNEWTAYCGKLCELYKCVNVKTERGNGQLFEASLLCCKKHLKLEKMTSRERECLVKAYVYTSTW